MKLAQFSAAPGSRILGLGTYRPPTLVSNAELANRIDSSDEWMRRRSGITSRRVASSAEGVIEMAAMATERALADAGIDAADVGAVLLASMSFGGPASAAAPEIAEAVGARSAAAIDISAACAGFCHALALADGLIRAGTARYVVVVGSERMSDIIDPFDRGTAFLFGDGAGAMIVGAADTVSVGPVVWGSDGSGHEHVRFDRSRLDPGGVAAKLRVAGQETFRWATEVVPDVSRRAMRAAGVTVGDLAAFIPHQANARIIDAIARSLHLPSHVAIARDIVESANTSAASIPLAADTLRRTGAVSTGDLALLVGFGGGLVYAAQVVELP